MAAIDENSKEKEAMLQMLDKQKTAIRKLKELGAVHIRLFDGQLLGKLDEVLKQCERLYRKLKNNEFEIAIVGLEKAGKSTFANALIENRILPDADERCTYTSTCLLYGDEKAKVEFYTPGEFDQKLRDNLEYMGFENVEQYSVATLRESGYMAKFNSLSDKEKRLYETNVHEDVLNILRNARNIQANYLGKPPREFSGDELDSPELKDYIVNPRVSIAVKKVTIESAKLGKMKNAIIYDVPGFDSPTKMHGEQTEEHMKQADAIILIASAEKPSFTAPALDMFNKVIDDDGTELSEKLFVFGNRADNATTLEKNIGTIKSEISKYKLLSADKYDNRLVIGSAKAHLQRIGKDTGDFCVKKIDEPEYKKIISYGDGIDHIYQKLQEYNENERFAVLTRNVKKNNQQIEAILKPFKEQYKDETSFANNDMKEVIRYVADLERKAEKKLTEKLQILRSEVRTNYSVVPLQGVENPLPLSQKLREEISALLGDGKYSITDKEREEACLALGGVSTSKDIEAVAIKICEAKFERIYQDLSQLILNVAIENHKAYYERIFSDFETALNMRKSMPAYDELAQKLATYIEKYKKRQEDEDVYQALIERFVRDLVEVLILRPYGLTGRLERFKADQNNLASLMMFYRSDTEAEKNAMLAIAPKDQPLLYSLLFHEYKDTVKVTNNVVENIKGFSKEFLSDDVIVGLALAIIKRNPITAAAGIAKVISRVKQTSRGKEYWQRDITSELRGLKADLERENREKEEQTYREFDFTNQKFDEQYKQFFVKHGLTEYEELQKSFDTDICILQDFLLTACIPAICIEKAFVAKEVKSIECLLTSIENDELGTFIRDNSEMLLKAAYDDFNAKLAEANLNKEVVKNVEEILKSLR